MSSFKKGKPMKDRISLWLRWDIFERNGKTVQWWMQDCTSFTKNAVKHTEYWFHSHLLFSDLQTGRVAHPLPPRGGGVQEIPEDSCGPRQQNHTTGNPCFPWFILKWFICYSYLCILCLLYCYRKTWFQYKSKIIFKEQMLQTTLRAPWQNGPYKNIH